MAITMGKMRRVKKRHEPSEQSDVKPTNGTNEPIDGPAEPHRPERRWREEAGEKSKNYILN